MPLAAWTMVSLSISALSVRIVSILPMIVTVKAEASATAFLRCLQASWILRKSKSRLKGTMCDVRLMTLIAVSYTGCSSEVNIAPQSIQRRRLQTELFRLFSRELITCVGAEQYVHTISTYCHMAIQKASGKVTISCG